jgi:hypothetical protein
MTTGTGTASSDFDEEAPNILAELIDWQHILVK